MIRVLLVEDDPVIRDTTCYFLKSQQNFEVVCAETGGDALSHAREKFDVILMDILLPDTNGVDLCQRLRSWHHCPIIFTSCLDDTDTIVRALEMGGDDFLAKPYNNKILLARIMANIRRVQMDGAEPSVNGYQQPQRGEGWPQRPSGRHGISHPHPLRPLPEHLLHSQRALPEDMGQGKPRRCADGAGTYPQPPQQDRTRPGKARLLKKCLGQGLCLPAGRRQGLRIVLMRAPTS